MAGPVNAHLFRGEIHGYWRLLARGADRNSIVFRKHLERRFDFGVDKDGFAVRTGGIVSPTEYTMSAGRYYYRFVGTNAYSKYGQSAVFGAWWIDHDTWLLLSRHARSGGDTLERAAQTYLALPDEWGDRGRIARGKLVQPLMAWTGIGNVAFSATGERFTPAQHNKAPQLFVPGDAKLFATAFGSADAVECIYTRDCPDHWRWG
jgi:hypothetical protein